MRPLDANDANRVKSDALQAIEVLQAVAKECDGRFAFPSYIREKADKARRCLEFIEYVCEEYMNEQEA